MVAPPLHLGSPVLSGAMSMVMATSIWYWEYSMRGFTCSEIPALHYLGEVHGAGVAVTASWM